MAKYKKIKKEDKEESVLETPELMVDRSGEFLKKYKTLITGLLVIIVLGVGAFMTYKYIKNSQEEEARNSIFPAERFLEMDSLQLALKGNGNYEGVLDISENYSMSKTADLAHFYAGIALMKEGKHEEALSHLEKFSSSDLIIQARAYALQGDAYMELKNIDKAIDYYNKAVDYKPNKYFTPIYMMKLALAYELKNKNKEAVETYQEIIDNYPKSSEVNNAKKYKARIEAQ